MTYKQRRAQAIRTIKRNGGLTEADHESIREYSRVASMEKLIAASSLGAPDALTERASADPAAVEETLRLADAIAESQRVDPQTLLENRRRLAHEAASADLKRLRAEGGSYKEILAAEQLEERLSYAE